MASKSKDSLFRSLIRAASWLRFKRHNISLQRTRGRQRVFLFASGPAPLSFGVMRHVKDFSIRRLEASDSEIAWRLAIELLRDPPDREAPLVELLSDDRAIVLAALDGTNVVGYLVAYTFPSLSGDKLVYLYDIEVASDLRRQGIGARMVALLREICECSGVDSIWVGSSLTNKAALALWTSTGAVRESDQYVEFTYEL